MKFSILLTLILLTGCGYKKGVTEIVPGQSAPQIDISGRSTSSGIVVTLTASNRSKSAYQLLEWNLPKHGELTTDLFRVNRGISQIQYTGLMYKRAVDDSSYVMIPPGTSMTVEIDLGQFYP